MVNELIKKLTGIFIEEEKSKCTEQDQLVKNAFSVYARVFNKECLGWQHNLEWNEMFLKQQQRYCNDKLRLRGHLFLNEVFDTLGFPRTKLGAIVGWVYDEKNPTGDNFVDFGMCTEDRTGVVENPDVILNFNVDGEILSKI